MDINGKYVYEATTVTDEKEKPIVRTYDEQKSETFTIREYEEKIARIEQNKLDTIASLDKEIADFQAKIDEATAALIVK